MSRDDRFACTWPDCGKTYGKACKLEEHLRSHTNTRPFVCAVEGCGKSFLRNGHLQRHRLTSHTASPRRFTCGFGGCDKSFMLRHHLRRHEKLHAEPRPYRCDRCSVGFARKEQLRRHQQTLHRPWGDGAQEDVVKNEKTYVCGMEGCSEHFTKWSSVVAHRRLHHPPLASEACPECGKSFPRRRNLQNHLRNVHLRLNRRDHRCEREGCGGRSFSSKHALKVHMATVHEGRKPYQCETCGRSFGHKHLLVRHRRTHTERAPTGSSEAKRESPPMERPLLDAFVGAYDEPSAKRRPDGTKKRQRDVECPVRTCQRRFFRQYDLDRHMLSAHPLDS